MKQFTWDSEEALCMDKGKLSVKIAEGKKNWFSFGVWRGLMYSNHHPSEKYSISVTRTLPESSNLLL